MKLRNLLLLISIMLAGCIPIVKQSPAPPVDHPQVGELFTVTDEHLMVIPVWEKYPTVHSEQSIRESSTLRLGNPVFTETGALYRVHAAVPSRTSASLMMPAAALGRGVFFYGYIIASETGNILLLDKSLDNRDLTRQALVGEYRKEELIAFMESGKPEALGDSEIWHFFDSKEIHIEFGDADRSRVITFLVNKDKTR